MNLFESQRSWDTLSLPLAQAVQRPDLGIMKLLLDADCDLDVSCGDDSIMDLA